MMRKGLLVFLWFPASFLFLALNLTMLGSMKTWERPNLPLSATAPSESVLTATSGTPAVLSAQVIAADARTLLIQNFLDAHASPMSPYANFLVQQADLYGLDFRLIPAIAMCESNLGKRVPLKAGFNPFGIAVYTGTQHGKDFDSWEHAISWVAKYIYDRYYARGITDLIGIQRHWAPPAAENGNSWANCVEYFETSIL